MRIKSIRIRNFRSISDLKLDLGSLTVICGPNSCGKSNIFEAIKFAFEENITPQHIYDNMTAILRDSPGAPKLSIWIDIVFENCPHDIRNMSGLQTAQEITYAFRAIRSGTISRKLGDVLLNRISLDSLKQKYHIIYVPPIRDLKAGGMEPFQHLFANVLARARGGDSLHEPANQTKQILKTKANKLLSRQTDLVKGILNASSLILNTDEVSFNKLYESVSLDVNFKEMRVPLAKLGTGQQSAVIMHLYRQFGEEASGHALFLFEEPDNHLHPSTIRAIGSDLEDISAKSQVLVSTHSPILIDHIGLHRTISLYSDDKRITKKRKMNLTSYTDAQIRSLLIRYGIRATEPLFAKKVIVVEGKTDIHVLSKSMEVMYGKLPDRFDILILAAEGNSRVVELCQFLHGMGVRWAAVFDWDAVIKTSSVPNLKDNIPVAAITAAKKGVLTLLPLIDSGSKRGRNAKGTIERILAELDSRRPTPEIYKGSEVEKLVNFTNILNQTEKDQLISDLEATRGKKFGGILYKTKICLWSGEIEDVLLSANGSDQFLENLLIKKGMLLRPMQADVRKNTLKNKLKELAEEPLIINEILLELFNGGMLHRTEIDRALDYFINIM